MRVDFVLWDENGQEMVQQSGLRAPWTVVFRALADIRKVQVEVLYKDGIRKIRTRKLRP